MRKPDLGLREYVALGALGIALAVGVFFVGANADGGGGSQSVVSPIPRPTASAIKNETPWTVTFVDTSVSPEVPLGQAPVDDLNFDFAGAPFPDVKDDAWKLLARTTFDAAPGNYALLIDFTGEIHVTLNGTDVGISPSRGSGTTSIPVVQGASPTVVLITVGDFGGPFRLHAKFVGA